MTRPINLFTADLLEYHGAIIEHEGQALKAVLPEALRSKLGLPEYAAIAFSPEAEEGAIRVSYGSDLFRGFSKLLGKEGCFSEVELPAPQVSPVKFEKKACEKVILNNAVYEIESHEIKKVSYLMSYFKYHAVSEEKREGVSSVLINEWNLSMSRYNGDIAGLLAEGNPKTVDKTAERQEISAVLEALKQAQSHIVAEELEEFVNSLKRRLNNDIRRVNEYYRTLIREINNRLRGRNLSGEEKDKYLGKIKTIETELRLKEQDLVDRYSLNIAVEPVSFIRFTAEAPVLRLRIKRRKLERLFPVAYNPVLKTADLLPCESCFKQDCSYYICDDKLHILCNECFAQCPACGKQYCHACHKSGCPRCTKNSSSPPPAPGG